MEINFGVSSPINRFSHDEIIKAPKRNVEKTTNAKKKLNSLIKSKRSGTEVLR